jgi:hypothetical protein
MSIQPVAASLPRVIVPVVLTLLALGPSGAVAAGRERGAECVAIDDATARLACYDAAFPRPAQHSAAGVPVAAGAANTAPLPAPAAPGAVAAAPAAAPVAASAPAAPAAQPASEAEKFGLSERQRAEREPRPEKPPANAVTGEVIALRKLPSGYLLIELDNAQQWQQIETDPNLYLRIGERVTIRKASLGSFLLETRSNHSTRVRRVQ